MLNISSLSDNLFLNNKKKIDFNKLFCIIIFLYKHDKKEK